MAGGGARVRLPADARAADPVRTDRQARADPGVGGPRLHRGRDGASRLHGVAGGWPDAASCRRRFGRVGKLPPGRWQARYHGPDGIDRAGAAHLRAPQLTPTAGSPRIEERGRWCRATGSTPTPAASRWATTAPGGCSSGRACGRGRVGSTRGSFRLHIAPGLGGPPADGHHVRTGSGPGGPGLLDTGLGEVTVAKAYRLAARPMLGTAVEDRAAPGRTRARSEGRRPSASRSVPL